jgi:hypothetical protein
VQALFGTAVDGGACALGGMLLRRIGGFVGREGLTVEGWTFAWCNTHTFQQLTALCEGEGVL